MCVHNVFLDKLAKLCVYLFFHCGETLIPKINNKNKIKTVLFGLNKSENDYGLTKKKREGTQETLVTQKETKMIIKKKSV